MHLVPSVSTTFGLSTLTPSENRICRVFPILRGLLGWYGTENAEDS